MRRLQSRTLKWKEEEIDKLLELSRRWFHSLKNHQKLHSSTAVSINISRRTAKKIHDMEPKVEPKQHKNLALCKCCLSTLCESATKKPFRVSSSYFLAFTFESFHTETDKKRGGVFLFFLHWYWFYDSPKKLNLICECNPTISNRYFYVVYN